MLRQTLESARKARRGPAECSLRSDGHTNNLRGDTHSRGAVCLWPDWSEGANAQSSVTVTMFTGQVANVLQFI